MALFLYLLFSVLTDNLQKTVFQFVHFQKLSLYGGSYLNYCKTLIFRVHLMFANFASSIK